MDEASGRLRDFERPPVVEVALSAQFDPLPQLDAAGMLTYWADELRHEFPTAQQHPVLEPAYEMFGRGGGAGLRVQLLSSGAAPARFWFINAESTDLVQLQQDRLVRNWRRETLEAADYPHFDYVRDRFRQDFERLQQFVSRRGSSKINVTQCEVSYINHIIVGHPGASPAAELHRVFSPWSGRFSDSDTPAPEDVQITQRHVLSKDGAEVGRLHITVQGALQTATMRPMLMMSLVARGRLSGSSIDDCLEFFELGHAAIVTGFCSVTTPAMHKIWGRTK